MTEAVEDKRHRGVRVMADCAHCGMPLPLPGPVREALCAHCQETNQLSPELWQELLDRVDSEGRSFAEAGKLEVDVTRDAPPEELQESGFDTPEWLQPWVPSTRRFYGAAGGPDDAKGPGPEVDRQSPAPVMMSCPQCAGSLRVTADTPRTVTCEYCSVDVYLPDDLWRRLHPVTKATRWYVEFAGESARDRDKRTAALRERRSKLALEQRSMKRRWFRLGMIALLAGVFCLPSGCVSCQAGLIATEDPMFGLHASVVCPLVCDTCDAPYSTSGNSEGSVTEVYCDNKAGGREYLSFWWLIFPLSVFLSWFVLLFPFAALWTYRRDRRARARLPEVEQEMASIDAELEAARVPRPVG